MAVNKNTPDNLSLKNLLFCKAIPNYVIPVPTDGHVIYPCKDCGDKFMFESSYEYHVNRKTVQVTYMCRPCNSVKIFYNRCNLLAHIRSHAFKTATINVSDLKIEPIPLSFFCYDGIIQNPTTRQRIRNMCYDCKNDIHETGIAYKDRVQHYGRYSTEVHTCPICLLVLGNECSLNTHLRIHLKQRPFFCPECGISLSSKNITYPYNHDCEGFKMMRATARSSCPIGNCGYFQPSELYDHFKNKHCKKIFRCASCSVGSFNETSIVKHVKKEHNTSMRVVVSFQCDLCPASLIQGNVLKKHITSHFKESFVYPCWTCGKVFTVATGLIAHYNQFHNVKDSVAPLAVNKENTKDVENFTNKSNLLCRVIKKCDKCNRCFTYKCKYNQIAILPNECPYRCSESPQETTTNNDTITCCFCKTTLNCDWNIIKNHFAQHHKEHKCLDVQILLSRDTATLNSYPKTSKKKNGGMVKKKKQKKKQFKLLQQTKDLPILSRNISNFAELKSQGKFPCKKCEQVSDSKKNLEAHVIAHRDPCMAYQCLECGECFVGRPSFGTHLVVEHSITDISDYINSKQCFNESALMKSHDLNTKSDDPLRENQCAICREEFENAEDLEKHFRVHGMAFLLKNTSKNTAPNS